MKAAQRQFLVKVEGIDGYFMTKSGGNISADTTKVYDGGKVEPEVIAAPAEAENVSLSRGFDPISHSAQLAQLRRGVGRLRATISSTPTDEDLIPIGTPEVYPGALLVGCNNPEADASSGDAATWELEFAIAGWK